MPLASAIVCTKGRSGSIVRVVAALLADPYESLELIVIDQSEDAATEHALEPWRGDPRFRYRHSTTRGKGAGLNEGIREAKGSIVVCTDDDCQPPPNWVSNMAATLSSQPTAVIAFCQVLPIEHDPTLGYVPVYVLQKNRLLRTISSICGGLGLGAGMAVRRDFALAIGGFDESFGPGARFPSADEWDLAIRALLMGKHVFETAELSIVHDGFRTFEEGLKHARRDWMAIGAVCAKPLRAGHFEALIVPLWLLTTRALLPPIADLTRLRKPRGLGRIVAFTQGFADGLATAVDGKTLRFR